MQALLSTRTGSSNPVTRTPFRPSHTGIHRRPGAVIPAAANRFYQGDPSSHFERAAEEVRRRARESAVRSALARSALKRLSAEVAGVAEGTGAGERTAATPYSHVNGFHWASYVSRRKDLDLAVTDAVNRAMKGSKGMVPELAIVFVSSHFRNNYGNIIPALRRQLPSLKCIVGCTGYGVTGSTATGPKEIEGDESAFSLTLGVLPGVKVGVKYVTSGVWGAIPDESAPRRAWESLMGVPSTSDTGASTSFVVLSDPEFSRLAPLLKGLDASFPGASVVGGLASGVGKDPGAVFVWEEGAVGGGAHQGDGAAVLVLHGDVSIDTMVAQGCRPLSDKVWTIEEVEEPNTLNAVSHNDGPECSPLAALAEEMADFSDGEREEIARHLIVGVVTDSASETCTTKAHDFLVRGVQVADEGKGTVKVGHRLEPGQHFRWMVRDAEGAHEDLVAHTTAWKQSELEAVLNGKPRAPLLGALMFSCNGRGSQLYGEDDHDASTLATYAPVPLAGFQCEGEIGPVGGSTWLHGFTASIGLLRAGGARWSVEEDKHT